MREAFRAHAPGLAAFMVMILIAATMAASIDAGGSAQTAGTGLPTEPIRLPGPGQDADGDSYADDVDVWDGDLTLRIVLSRLDAPQVRAPYFVIGTQDDQWRTGAGRALEWTHIVDHDALGRDPGSPAWTRDVLRTGTWVYSVPMEDSAKAIAETGVLAPDDVPRGTEWPQSFHVNVRDDAPRVTATAELYDAERDPDRLAATWSVEVDIPNATWRMGDGEAAVGSSIQHEGLEATLETVSAISPGTQAEVAARWAPAVHFASGERFFPTAGEALAQFHGFARREADERDYRTWTTSFNNGRDGYVLLLADFNGDRRVDHEDARLMTDILRAGGVAPDRVYAHVANATGDRVVVQYWFLYMYNFVRGETGEGIELLAHAGDREFIQLTFDSLEDARTGRPASVAYSQHYKGIRVLEPPAGVAPFSRNDTHIDVYSAVGSHASYPAPGDDRRFRPAFRNWGDTFDGRNGTWEPGDYEMELLGGQAWHQGHLWGPVTRHSRDLGTATKPLLQHTFRYPFQDPVAWERVLQVLDAQDIEDTYGGA